MASSPPKPATIREVARIAGVSRATVSNVLHGRDGRVAPATQERVLAAIKELNYRPPLAPATSSGAMAASIGFLVQNQERHLITRHGFYASLFEGYLYGASAAEFSVTVMVEALWENAKAAVRRYCDGRIDGILIVSPPVNSDIVDHFTNRGFPTVVLGGHASTPDVCAVNCDNRAGGRLAAQHLVELGHTELAYITFREQNEDSIGRYQGFSDEARRLGLAEPQMHCFTGVSDKDEINKAVYAATERRATGIFCFNDEAARFSVDALAEMGLSVPDDVSIVGFDDTQDSRIGSVPITTVRQPIFEMAEHAAVLLIELAKAQSNGLRLPVTKQIFQPEFVARRSTGPVPARIPASSETRA